MKSNKNNKINDEYYYDASKLFELMKKHHISWLRLCNSANTNQSVLGRIYNGRNVEIKTVLNFIDTLQKEIDEDIDVSKLFVIKKRRKR